MKHLIVEGYCDAEKELQEYPCEGTMKLGVYCFLCKQFSYAECPNEIALSDSDGVVKKSEDYIGFGGNMEPNEAEKMEMYVKVWQEICRKKIDEAYQEFINWADNE